MGNIHVNMEFGPVVQEEMPLKSFSYLELWQPFCKAECHHLCNVFTGYYEKQSRESILNLGQCFRCHLKDFLSGAQAALLCGGAEPLMQF